MGGCSQEALFPLYLPCSWERLPGCSMVEQRGRSRDSHLVLLESVESALVREMVSAGRFEEWNGLASGRDPACTLGCPDH